MFSNAGLLPFLAYSAMETFFLHGRVPFTLNISQEDHEATLPAWMCSRKGFLSTASS